MFGCRGREKVSTIRDNKTIFSSLDTEVLHLLHFLLIVHLNILDGFMYNDIYTNISLSHTHTHFSPKSYSRRHDALFNVSHSRAFHTYILQHSIHLPTPTHRKGKSKSALPYKRSPPSWLKTSSVEIQALVCKLAKKGLKPSQIGVVLRDSHGVAKVKSVTGSTVLRILKKEGLAPQLPEDLYQLIKKAVSVRKHLERNRKDKDSKFRLILIESRIHRISRYYKRSKQLPANWKYDSGTANALVA